MTMPRLWKGRKVLIYVKGKFIGKGIYLGSERMLNKDLTSSSWIKVFKLKGNKKIYETECNWYIIKDKK